MRWSGTWVWWSGWLVSMAWVGIGVSCGGRSFSGDEASGGGGGRASSEPDIIVVPPPARPSMGPASPPPDIGPDVDGSEPVEPPPVADEAPFGARDVVSAMLGAFCGRCHGREAVEAGRVAGGIDYVEDVERLVEEGLIVPLRSSCSPVVAVMVSGEMPPPDDPLARPSNQDVRTIRDFIDNPNFWASGGSCAPVGVGQAVDAGAGPDASAPLDAGGG